MGYENIEKEDIHEKFRQSGLWPMDYRFTSFASDGQPESNYFLQPKLSMSDNEAVQQLISILLSKENSATILKEAASILSRMWRVEKILKGFHRESIVSAKPINSGNHRKIRYRKTPTMCPTLGEMIEDRKRRVQEKGLQPTLKKKKKQKRC